MYQSDGNGEAEIRCLDIVKGLVVEVNRSNNTELTASLLPKIHAARVIYHSKAELVGFFGMVGQGKSTAVGELLGNPALTQKAGNGESVTRNPIEYSYRDDLASPPFEVKLTICGAHTCRDSVLSHVTNVLASIGTDDPQQHDQDHRYQGNESKKVLMSLFAGIPEFESEEALIVFLAQVESPTMDVHEQCCIWAEERRMKLVEMSKDGLRQPDQTVMVALTKSEKDIEVTNLFNTEFDVGEIQDLEYLKARKQDITHELDRTPRSLWETRDRLGFELKCVDLEQRRIFVLERNRRIPKDLISTYADMTNGRQLKVFALSSTAYTENTKGYDQNLTLELPLSVESSGFPGFIHELAGIPCERIQLDMLDDVKITLPALLSLIEIYCTKPVAMPPVVIKVDFDTTLTRIEKLLCGRLDAFIEERFKPALVTIRDTMPMWIESAGTLCDKWATWHGSRHRAFMLKHGSHRTRTQAWTSWNAKLLHAVQATIDPLFMSLINGVDVFESDLALEISMEVDALIDGLHPTVSGPQFKAFRKYMGYRKPQIFSAIKKMKTQMKLFFKKLRVQRPRLKPRRSPHSPETIHVWYGGKWERFKDWLPARTAESDLTSKAGWKALRRMWRANYKHFRFLDLPQELRDQIYELSLGGEIYPLNTVAHSELNGPTGRQDARLTLGMIYDYDILYNERSSSSPIARLLSGTVYAEPAHRSTWAPNLALLRVLWQVHDEVLSIGWSVMRKRFFDPLVFTTAVDARLGSAMRYNYLKIIELSFANKQYSKFFGVEIDPQFQLSAQSSLGQYLQDLPGVKDLQLRFHCLKKAM
ncbi:hypothetical protein CC86DRAFT_434411 [Ophiobolus disseminans]|uniref:DUF7605 domain-containing protein n=1 Tax=Ophiobolus disseminans TaxID=1469910 RepID=A0A6A7ABI8_9PLEO|nr:hypothetical protein CC86DRAFT_434411 [Ophiobolus disseminans]